jgi:hypothetical protein
VRFWFSLQKYKNIEHCKKKIKKNKKQRTEKIQNSKKIPSHALRARNDGDSLWSFAAAKRIVIFALEWCRRFIPVNSKSSFRGCTAAEGNSNEVQRSF